MTTMRYEAGKHRAAESGARGWRWGRHVMTHAEYSREDWKER